MPPPEKYWGGSSLLSPPSYAYGMVVLLGGYGGFIWVYGSVFGGMVIVFGGYGCFTWGHSSLDCGNFVQLRV